MARYKLERLDLAEDWHVRERFATLQAAIAELNRCTIAKDVAGNAVEKSAEKFLHEFVYNRTAVNYKGEGRGLQPKMIELVGDQRVFWVPHNGKTIRALYHSFGADRFYFVKLHQHNEVKQSGYLVSIISDSPEFYQLLYSLTPEQPEGKKAKK